MGHGVLSWIGASSNGGDLLSGVLSLEVLETVAGRHAAASLDFADTLALNLLMGAILFLFSVALLTFLKLGLVSG